MLQTRETFAAALASLRETGRWDPTKPIAAMLIAEWATFERIQLGDRPAAK